MNQRIRELAEQATSIVEMVGPQGYTSSYANFDREKFAELIVAECIDPIEFQWDETNASVGIIAQEIAGIDLSDYTMINSAANTGLSIGPVSVTNDWASGSTISFANIASIGTLHADTTKYGKTTIKTAKSTIDLDELADMMDTLKKRLLILAPNFEKHEKYPMLKELYNEYKAMEALLSGPDSNE